MKPILPRLLWLSLAFAAMVQGASPVTETSYPPDLKPAQHEAQAAHMAAELLARYHYKSEPLNEALSDRVFDQYLKSLDPEKLFFNLSDIEQLSAYRSRLGDAILAENLTVPFTIYNRFQHRTVERFSYARTLLKSGFDFQASESYQYAREKASWPKTESEVHELWRKRVKNDWLRLKLAGMDAKGIAEILDKRYDSSLKRIGRVQSADAFQAFMNAYTMAIEPHTNYMGPRAAEDFDISMRLSLVGIGAVLAEMDEYTTIRELVAGGPASQSGQLKVGDRIVGVAQGEGGIMTDIMGRRLDESVTLIRGAPDSIVVLDVLPAEAGPDGKHRLVTLTRKRISLEEQAAKGSVQTIKDGASVRRVGVIVLPSFYEDFAARQKGAPDYRSVTRDVARLLAGFKKEGVASVLIDLRNNGGGSLSEAVELTGLFIDKGPVVQQRSADGSVKVESDTNAGVAWDGPLGVLINRASASSSEIFAAAIQDYGRGLIIGEPSFGKGTVQTMLNLDEIASTSTAQLGELKMTVAQFFRINGSSTQLIGVIPDIPFPVISDTDAFGESSFDNALPSTQIKAADYSPAGDLKGLLPLLRTLHETRVKQDADFRFMQEDIAALKLLRSKNQLTLNEAERRKERDVQEARDKARELQMKAAGSAAPFKGGALQDDGLQPGERNLTSELAAEAARKGNKDILLIEAAQILSDEVGLLTANARLAAQVNPGTRLAPQ